MADDIKTVLTLDTNWRLDVLGGRTYGVCWVEVAEPLECLSVRRGFPLTNPSHFRCSLFSLVMGLELAHSIPDMTSLLESAGVTDWFCNVMVRNRGVYDLFCGPTSEKMRRWAASDGGTAVKCGYRRDYAIKVLSMIDALRESGRGDVTFVSTNSEANILLKHSVNLDVDPKRDLPKGKGSTHENEDTIRSRLDALRAKDAVRKELMESGGARSTRAKRRMTKKERARTLDSEIKKSNPTTTIKSAKITSHQQHHARDAAAAL